MIRAALTHVLAEELEIDGRQYRAELAKPRSRWSVVLQRGDTMEILGLADDKAGAEAQAARLNAQLAEFAAGHDSAGVLQ